MSKIYLPTQQEVDLLETQSQDLIPLLDLFYRDRLLWLGAWIYRRAIRSLGMSAQVSYTTFSFDRSFGRPCVVGYGGFQRIRFLDLVDRRFMIRYVDCSPNVVWLDRVHDPRAYGSLPFHWTHHPQTGIPITGSRLEL